MTEFEQLLLQRRSIREFDENYQVSSTEIEKIVAAALAIPAPSGNMPLKIYQIVSPEGRMKLEQELMQGKENLLKEALAKGKKKNIIHYYWRYTSYLFRAPVILALSCREYNSLLSDSSTHTLDNAKLTLGQALFSMSLMIENLQLSSSILTAPLVFCPHLAFGNQEGEKLCAFMALGRAKEGILLGPKEKREVKDYLIKL